jgi:hypothetical protein
MQGQWLDISFGHNPKGQSLVALSNPLGLREEGETAGSRGRQAPANCLAFPRTFDASETRCAM